MKKFIVLLALLYLIFSCKSFTSQGRSLNQAKRAGREGQYGLAVHLVIEALKIDPQFYSAMEYLNEIFQEAHGHYSQILDEYLSMADSTTPTEGEVILPADKIIQNYRLLEEIHSAVALAGLTEMHNGKDDQTYTLAVEDFQPVLTQWVDRSMALHYEIIEDLLAQERAMPAKTAHKHALFIMENYNNRYRDITTLEQQALNAAQIDLQIVILQEAESPPVDIPELSRRMHELLDDNLDIATYVNLIPWTSDEEYILYENSFDRESFCQTARESSIEYLLLFTLKNQLNHFDKEVSFSKDFIMEELETADLDDQGEYREIPSNSLIIEVTQLLEGRVQGEVALMDTERVAYYQDPLELIAETREYLSYVEVLPGDFNALLKARSGLSNRSYLDLAKESFERRSYHGAVLLHLEDPLFYVEQTGDYRSQRFITLNEIFHFYLFIYEDYYRDYMDQVVRRFDDTLTEENILPQLWLELMEQGYGEIAPLLE